MTFADNIKRICRLRGTTLTAVVKRLGLSTNKVTLWNNGTLPKAEVMLRLADELGCKVIDFFADEADLEQLEKLQAITEDEWDLINAYRTANRRGKHELMVYAYGLEKQ